MKKRSASKKIGDLSRRTPRAQPKTLKIEVYRWWRCQFCGEKSAESEWQNGGSVCPKCGREYDAILAQDCEED